MELVSNVLLVPKDSVSAVDYLQHAGHSESDAEKIVAATGFHYLSRFHEASVASLIRQNAAMLRQVIEPYYSRLSSLIVVTQSNRQIIPNSASVMHDVLNLPQDTLCIEVVDGCNGFVKALRLANNLVDEGDMCLIFSGDINSKMVEQSDAGTAALFGDGYALTIVKKSGAFRSKILQDGSKGPAISFGEQSPHLVMDGFEVFAFSTRVVPELISNHIGGEFDLNRFVVFHQASKLIVESLEKKTEAWRAGYSAFNARNYGNLGPASIPGWLAQQASIPSRSQIFCVGFGAGLSWGFAEVTWEATYNEVVYV